MESTVRQELETFYRMSGVFIQMLLFEAEQPSATLRADVNYMENYRALEDIKDFEKLSSAGGEFSLQKKKAASKLPTLGSAMMMSQSDNAEAQALREENEKVKRSCSRCRRSWHRHCSARAGSQSSRRDRRRRADRR